MSEFCTVVKSPPTFVVAVTGRVAREDDVKTAVDPVEACPGASLPRELLAGGPCGDGQQIGGDELADVAGPGDRGACGAAGRGRGGQLGADATATHDDGLH